MATLILTSVGTLLGGPLGGMVGAAAGQSIDQRLFGPRGRQGPRLADLRVQSSHYGTPVPRVYGRMRIAGTMIWAADIVERRQRSRAAKGAPRNTTYRYTASFAIALSSRPIIAVHRIWADGKLLRGQDGGWTQDAVMRLHDGSAGQSADPLIVAAEGVEAAPAYRDFAYVVFEDLDLTPFGNRIPLLTFEVEADAGPVPVAQPLADLLGRPVATPDAPPMVGHAVSGGARRDAVADLLPVAPVSRAAGGTALRPWGAVLPTEQALEPAARSGEAEIERSAAAARQLPRSLSVQYHDPARDYQAGRQSVTLIEGEGRERELNLLTALDAAAARQWAVLLGEAARRDRHQLRLPSGPALLAFAPGDRLMLPDGDMAVVVSRDLNGATGEATLRPFPAALFPAGAADSGRAVTAIDQPVGETIAAIFDLPAPLDGPVDVPRVAIAASGSGLGWRRGLLTITGDAAEAQSQAIESVALIGKVASVTGSPTALLFDDASALIVDLARADMALTGTEDAALLAGANAAMAGRELLQFGLVEQIGPTRWRLTRLLRDRAGAAASGQFAQAGDSFVLLDDPALLSLSDTRLRSTEPMALAVRAAGGGLATTLSYTGPATAMQPLSPVHMAARWQADGALTLSWIRRSRLGYRWRDLLDVPLDAQREAYRITITTGAVQSIVETVAPRLERSAAEVAAWRSGGATSAHFAVAMIGDAGLSASVDVDVPL